jgi:hypothetical protein
VGRDRNRSGKIVLLNLRNSAGHDITFSSPWLIKSTRNGEVVARIFWDGDRTLGPGVSQSYFWSQHGGDCYERCSSYDSDDFEAGLVPAGRYKAEVQTSEGTVSVRFAIGEYFTLGFESRPQAKFVVYVTTAPEVEQMTAEAEAEDKTLIVSGLVQHRKRFNRDWNFSMGPGTIVLGEFFIEVCDGSPYYVQRHKKEWLGERWCPWSSYVEKIGR